MKFLNLKKQLAAVLFISALACCKKSNTTDPVVTPPAKNKIAFIYKADKTDADTYKALMVSYSSSVTAVDSSEILGFDFSSYNLIVAGDNSASNAAPYTDNAALKIKIAGKPILYLGFGGNKLAQKTTTIVNWMSPSIFGGALTDMQVIDPSSSLYKTPNKITLPANQTLQFYTAGSPSLAFYKSVAATIPNVELIIKADPVQVTFFSVAYQTDKDGFYGYYNTPLSQLTKDGKDFLVNFSFYVGKLSL